MSLSSDPSHLLELLTAAEGATERAPGRMLRSIRSAPAVLLRTLREDPDRLFDHARMLKEGDRTTVAALDFDGLACVIKRANLKHALHTMTHSVLRSRARWYWVNARRLATLGVRVAAPLAICEERRGPFRFRSFLISEFIEGDTLDVAIDQCADRAALEKLARRFADIWRTIGQARLRHGDPKPTNFIIDHRGELTLIDIDSMRAIPRSLPYSFVRRRENRRLLRNWHDRPEVAAVFRTILDESC